MQPPAQYLFISYKRGQRSTPMMQRFYHRAEVELRDRGVVPFFDRDDIDIGAEWTPAIQDFIAKTTLFVACISIAYWRSEACMNELTCAIERHERSNGESPKLLFILGDDLNPSSLSLDDPRVTKAFAKMADRERKDGALRRLRHLGQINFLGPYDPSSGQLVRLRMGNSEAGDRQLAAMIKTLRQYLPNH